MKAIPDGLENRAVPYLMIDGAERAIAWYKSAFGATEEYRLEMPNGKLGHAELRVFGAPVYLADAPDDMPGGLANPVKLRGTSVIVHIYLDDVDAAFSRAFDAGAVALTEPKDEFYGDRVSVLEDPFGHVWSLHSRVREVSVEEMKSAVASFDA